MQGFFHLLGPLKEDFHAMMTRKQWCISGYTLNQMHLFLIYSWLVRCWENHIAKEDDGVEK